MKKLNPIIALAIVSAFLLANSSGGFTLDYTGSTGLNGSSCGASTCHGGTMGVDSTLLNVRVLSTANEDITKTASGYVLGAMYNVEIKFKVGSNVKAGFQVVPLTFMGTNPAGIVFNTTMPSLIQINPDAAGRQYVSHTLSGTTSSTVISGGFATWKFKWQAPSTNLGAINFHCIANLTNNNNLASGDSVRMATYTIQQPQIGVSVPEISTSNKLRVYPNPTSSTLFLEEKISVKETQYVIYNYFGKLVTQGTLSTNQLNVQNLVHGFYLLHIQDKNNFIFSTSFEKRD